VGVRCGGVFRLEKIDWAMLGLWIGFAEKNTRSVNKGCIIAWS
jgi:hypothetical protein